MTIVEIVKQGLYYARTCRSLWLFGFFVGVASGGSSGGGNGGGDGGAALASAGMLDPSVATMASIGIVVIIAVVAAILMRFVSEGALIEGIARVRKGETQTVGEGFRAGWAHWGVLFRIALLYLGATIGSLALLAAPAVIAARAAGWPVGILVALPSLLVAIPWLVTLYLVQAFASRIAVLENRRALDSIRRARLFLHDRLMHGLKLLVATFVGSMVLVVIAFAVAVPVVLLLFAAAQVINVFAVIIVGCLLLLPVFVVLAAMMGTLKSSIWTVGYLIEQKS